jgi:iron complex outermembrane recepter protein
MTSYFSAATLRILLAATLLGSAYGQTAPTPAAPAADQDPVIELSPFMVTADQDVGYVAASSLSGSRLNTRLRDIPASISVFTEEFMSDIGALTFEEAAAYANNLEFELTDGGTAASPNMNTLVTQFQNYRVRGLPTTTARNYFEWNMPTDNYNVGRIEDSRGPNAVLFGIAQAGGLINTATKQAVLGRSFTRLSATYGSFDSYRGTIDVNRTAFDNKLAVRFNALYDQSNSYRHHLSNEDRRIHLAARYNIAQATSIRAEYEGGIMRGNRTRPFNLSTAVTAWLAAGRPTVNTPTAAATGTARLNANQRRVTHIANTGQLFSTQGQRITTGPGTVIMDPALTDRSINVNGPGKMSLADFDTLSVYLEQRVGSKTFVELAYNYQHYKVDIKDPSIDANPLRGDPNNFLPTNVANPFAGGLYLETRWFRTIRVEESNTARATITTELDARKWGNYRLVGMGEYVDGRFASDQMGEYWEGAPFDAIPENNANLVWRRHYVTEGDWRTYRVGSDVADGPIVNMLDPISGQTLSSVWHMRSQGTRDVPTLVKSLLVGTQARYFDNRLVANLGYRRDLAYTVTPAPNVRDSVSNRLILDPANDEPFNFTGGTKTLGLVGHVTKNISLLGNYATNVGLPNARNYIIGGSKAPAREGEGKDIGVALTFLDGQINVRAVYYETAGRNLVQNWGIHLVNERVLDAAVNNGLITQAQADARSLTELNVLRKDSQSDGYEFQITANPTRNWRLMANYSITDNADLNIDPEFRAWWEDNSQFWASLPQNLVLSSGSTVGADLALWRDNWNEFYGLEGRTNSGNRKHKVNMFARYSFDSGFLKGFSAGGGYLHQSKIVIGRSGVGTNDFAYQYGNSHWRADAMLGYDVSGLPRKTKLRLQLNVNNVFDKTDPLILRMLGSDINRLALRPPRTWRLSANLDF